MITLTSSNHLLLLIHIMIYTHNILLLIHVSLNPENYVTNTEKILMILIDKILCGMNSNILLECVN